MKKRLRKKYNKIIGEDVVNTVPFPQIKGNLKKYGRYNTMIIRDSRHKMRMLVFYKGNIDQITRTSKAWRRVARLKYNPRLLDILTTWD